MGLSYKRVKKDYFLIRKKNVKIILFIILVVLGLIGVFFPKTTVNAIYLAKQIVLGNATVNDIRLGYTIDIDGDGVLEQGNISNCIDDDTGYCYINNASKSDVASDLVPKNIQIGYTIFGVTGYNMTIGPPLKCKGYQWLHRSGDADCSDVDGDNAYCDTVCKSYGYSSGSRNACDTNGPSGSSNSCGSYDFKSYCGCGVIGCGHGIDCACIV